MTSERRTLTLDATARQPLQERDDAPEVAMQTDWVFRLSKRDALLVLKALGGRLKAGPETEAAKELGDRLTVLRAKIAEDHFAALQRARDHVEGKDDGEAAESDPH